MALTELQPPETAATIKPETIGPNVNQGMLSPFDK
jgi:hypothetical protein